MLSKILTRIILAVLFCFTISISDSFGQIPVDTTKSNYAVLRIDYCSNWITTSYGNNKTTQERLQRSKQLPINDQIGSINNMLADALNKLAKEGYKIVSGTSDVNNGSTCGLTYILFKDPENK